MLKLHRQSARIPIAQDRNERVSVCEKIGIASAVMLPQRCMSNSHGVECDHTTTKV